MKMHLQVPVEADRLGVWPGKKLGVPVYGDGLGNLGQIIDGGDGPKIGVRDVELDGVRAGMIVGSDDRRPQRAEVDVADAEVGISFEGIAGVVDFKGLPASSRPKARAFTRPNALCVISWIISLVPSFV
ncbi:MAG: hypothetical protein M3392_10360 [Actinomycetota bacterium]|nr:hypothetical protein [Actinomycetota bacterium]